MSAGKKRKHGIEMRYEGVLKQKIDAIRPGLLWSDEQIRRASEDQTKEMFDKIPALFQAFGIAEGEWMSLALALARAHVPGFQFKARPGHPSTWTEIEKAELWLDVRAVMNRDGVTEVDALAIVRKLEPWAGRARRINPDSLRSIVAKADKRYIELVRRARAAESLGPTD